MLILPELFFSLQVLQTTKDWIEGKARPGTFFWVAIPSLPQTIRLTCHQSDCEEKHQYHCILQSGEEIYREGDQLRRDTGKVW